MNHCPVYLAVGGHAYGWVYPGPMGAVLTPSLIGVEQGGQLPNASTFCGRCEEVCPMRIPLPKMMRHWREREFEKNLQPAAMRWGLGLWRAVAAMPWAYRLGSGLGARALRLMARGGRIRRLPLVGGWTDHRDFPAPEGGTFQSQGAGRRWAVQGVVWLAPCVLAVHVRRLDIDPEWKLMADMALIGYVLVCLVALIVRAEG